MVNICIKNVELTMFC